MRKAILGPVLLAMSIACTGCSGGGDGEGSGGSGGSGSTAPLSFDAETSLRAAGGAAAATAFAAQFGGTIASILDALGNAPEAASFGVTRKINVSDFICTGGGSADLTGQIVEGEEVKLVLNDCLGSAFGAGSVSGDITLTINSGTNFDLFNGGPIYATAVVMLDISPGGSLVGGFDAFAEASAGLAMINLRLGNQLDSDLLTLSEGGQVLQLGCFDILQRIQLPSGFVAPRGVANLAGQIYTINDYATSSVPPIDFDATGVPRGGEMTLVSGDGSIEGSDRSGPCQPFVGTPAGDNSYVDALFSAGGCISLSGAKFDGSTFEASTSWDKLLDRDFTEGGGESCGGGGTGGTGGSTTGATPGPTACDPGTDIFALADAYIQGDGPEGNNSDTPFGNAGNLVIKSVSNMFFTRKIYIVFDLSLFSRSFTKASLVLTLQRHVVNPDPAKSGPQPVNVFGINDDNDWDPAAPGLGEDEITWSNAPRNVTAPPQDAQFETSPGVPTLIAGYDFDLGGDGVIDPPTDREIMPPVVTRYALDITEYVKERLDNDADGKITILMAASNPMNFNEDGSAFFSLQASEECDHPFLHFE
jgi:hypothetical protein